MPRVTRIAGSFVIVVIAYWAYALLAVPWIEPLADPGDATAISPENRADVGGLVDLRIKQFEGLFPPDAWELKNPKILESDRAKLLFQKYRNLGDGRVEIAPCTIVFDYEGPADDEAQRRRQSVVLETPGGAILQFDEAFDLKQAKIGRLVEGQLNGPITIRSQGKKIGPEDDLLITTRDVQLTKQCISTPHPVDFRWGPHSGRGSQMRIELLADTTKPDTATSGPNIVGIESFELQHVERLHLDLGQAMSPAKKKSGMSGNRPVDITCEGPFRFDMVQRVATFRDRVDVRQPNPSGPADQIACELLSLFFVDRPKEKPDPNAVESADKTPDSLNLIADRLEARGNPVVVTAPSRKLNARGPRIEYNLRDKSIRLDGGREVFLQQGPNEIHASSLHYQAEEGARFGRVMAQGPGWVRGRSDDHPDQMLEAVWNAQLWVFPRERKQVISLSGGAELKLQGMGQLQAKEIIFRLAETPIAGKGARSSLRPDRMLARGNVHMNSPQLSGKVENLEVWFEEPPGGSGAKSGGKEAAREEPKEAIVRGGVQSPVQPVQPTVARLPKPEPLERYEVTGRLLRARVLLGGKQPEVSHLLIEDEVCFDQTQTAKPNEQPLRIRGDRLEVFDATMPYATITVTGKPARFEGGGLGLAGPNINLNRGTNRLWIDGAGRMDMPFAGDDMPGQPAAAPGRMTVDWQRRMKFDGRTVHFEQSVVAVSPRQRLDTEKMEVQLQLNTEKMEVQLQRPIRFSEPKMEEQPCVEVIRCYGGVAMENWSWDLQRQLTSHDRMRVSDVAVNVLSGALTAGGPGWINSVRRGSDISLGSRASAPASRPAADTSLQDDKLNCLHIKFQGSISGNLRHRQLTFHDQVRLAYAPADGWDTMLTTEDPRKLGPKGVTARCDQLSVVEMPVPIGNQRSIELEATGSTVVEGTTYTARGHRITYAEAKGMLVLEGDGRSDAELFRQLKVGAPASKAAAQKIHFWPKTNRLKVVGAQSLQIGQFPGNGGAAH